MYLARFSYDVLPINRQRAIDFIRREVEAARGDGPASAKTTKTRQGISASASVPPTGA
jgi:hypothetical protein